MDPQQQYFNIQSNERGEWELQIDNNLEPGLHSLVVSPDDGGADEVALFYVQDRYVPVEQKSEFFPVIISWGVGLLLLLIIGLSIYDAFLAYHQTHTLKNGDKTRRVNRLAILIAALSIIITIGYGYSLYKQTSLPISSIQNLIDGVTKDEPQFADVSGTFIHPTDSQPFGGMHVVAGDTSIRVTDSGYFVFTNVDKDKGLRITHPELRRALLHAINSERLQIYFEPTMYNRLIDVMNAEARGNVQAVYDSLPAVARVKSTFEQFQESYDPFVSANHLSDQELRILSTKIVNNQYLKDYDLYLERAIAVEVEVDGQATTYYVSVEGSDWRIIR